MRLQRCSTEQLLMICNSGEDEVFHVEVFSALIILNYVPAANSMAD